jgi:hypothetical protein
VWYIQWNDWQGKQLAVNLQHCDRVLFQRVVLFCVMWLIVVPLSPRENPFSVKIEYCMSYQHVTQSKALSLLICVCETPFSKFGRETDYAEIFVAFLSSFRQVLGLTL